MQVEFHTAADNAVILNLKEVPSAQSIGRLKAIKEQIVHCLGDTLVCAIPSYESILITFDAMTTHHKAVISCIQARLNEWQVTSHLQDTGKIIRLPVYYDDTVGPDLERIATHHNTRIEDVVTRHCMNIYTIFAIGFAPGFAYLGHVDDEIAMPRHKTPRKKVAKGSVGIADHQTAIYPSDSPGGWNIIGRCPSDLFNLTKDQPLPFQVGDRIQFMPITQSEFLDLGGSLDDL
jgi:KipI family sensor histidine kinase inhibitor